jgi:hypothetical protein
MHFINQFINKIYITAKRAYRDAFKKKRDLNWFNKDLKQFKSLNTGIRFSNDNFGTFPCLNDKTKITNFDAHYIYHPAWAARIVKNIAPDIHVDISSTLHFCSILSAFVKTDFYDYRPANLTLSNLNCKSADLTDLPFASDSINSLSCMHTIEHIGLGRYGDPIDPDGDIKAINELKRVCARNGNLLIVVPVGKKSIQFNAHRIYDPFDIVSYMDDAFKLKNFSLVNDHGAFINDASLENAAQQQYGCGCYWFIKINNDIS